MKPEERLVAVGRVGAPHGRDGSFWVEAPLQAGSEEEEAREPLEVGAEVTVAGRRAPVERRGGAPARPLVRLAGIDDRGAAAALRGEALLVAERRAPLGRGEWLVEDLVGARIEGLGEVRRVVAASSCDLLEVGDDGMLIPFVSDAIKAVDPHARVIEVDRRFLGVEEREGGEPSPGGPATAAAGRGRAR